MAKERDRKTTDGDERAGDPCGDQRIGPQILGGPVARDQLADGEAGGLEEAVRAKVELDEAIRSGDDGAKWEVGVLEGPLEAS